MKIITTLAGCTLIAMLAAGCQDAAAPTPDSLRNVKVPDGFDFATSRSVALTVSASEDKLGTSQGLLEVALPSGEVLHRGPVNAGTPLTLNLSVPTKDADLLLKVTAGDKRLSGTAGIQADGQASFEIR